MSAFEETVAKNLALSLTAFGASHKHIAETVHTLFQHTVKSVVENGSFVLYQWQNDSWTRLPHTNLLLNPIRQKLVAYFDKARSYIDQPKRNDPDYYNKYKRWQETYVKFMSIQESLYNHTFMKCVLEEAILLFYTSNPV